MPHWGLNFETLGEIMRFVLACSWIALIAVGVVHLLRYAIKVYQEIRWWK
jgi:hypothetical protein